MLIRTFFVDTTALTYTIKTAKTYMLSCFYSIENVIKNVNRKLI